MSGITAFPTRFSRPWRMNVGPGDRMRLVPPMLVARRQWHTVRIIGSAGGPILQIGGAVSVRLWLVCGAARQGHYGPTPLFQDVARLAA